MAKFPKPDRSIAGARIVGLLLPFLALVAVWLMGCRQPAPPAQGWVRLAALRSLHPNQAMLVDIDHRLTALAAQRARLLEHPTSPLPPDAVPLDLPAAAPLPVPEPVRAPAHPIVLIEPRLAELRARLNEDLARQDVRLRQELETERAAVYQEKERELRQRTDARREETAKAYALRIPPARIRLRLAAEEAKRARDDADVAQARAARARERADAVVRNYAKNPTRHRKEIRAAEENAGYYENRAARLKAHADEQQEAAEAIARQIDTDTRELADAQARLGQELRQNLATIDRELVTNMQQRLTTWRQRAEEEVERKVADRAAQLADENAHPPADPPPPLAFPELPARPMSTKSDRIRIAVNTADFQAFRKRLDAVRAVDAAVDKLTAERRQLCQAIDQDTRQAALSIAAQHNWTVQFDRPSGPEITPAVRRWLAEYWPPADAADALRQHGRHRQHLDLRDALVRRQRHGVGDDQLFDGRFLQALSGRAGEDGVGGAGVNLARAARLQRLRAGNQRAGGSNRG